MKIFLVRHGETSRGKNGVYGYSAPLTELGKVQAELTGKFMAGLGITRIVSSDAVRALQTADPLHRALKLDIDVVPELIEIDIGKPSDGLSPITENRTPEGDYVMDCVHLGGESWEKFSGRVSVGLEILNDRFADDDVVAVFTHGGVKSVAIDLYSGREPSRVMRTLFNNGSISTVERSGSTYVVQATNEVSHLT